MSGYKSRTILQPLASQVYHPDIHPLIWLSLQSIHSISIYDEDYAKKALGDVVYIDLPVKGNKQVTKDTIGAVESVKAASDIYAPIVYSFIYILY